MANDNYFFTPRKEIIVVDHLGLRPNYHQTEIRVEGHVFITVLAYHLMWSILQMLQASGDNRRWETIRRILQTHAYTTILVPTQEGKRYRVRRAGQPEECQKAVYKILKVDWRSLPQFSTVVDTARRLCSAYKIVSLIINALHPYMRNLG